MSIKDNMKSPITGKEMNLVRKPDTVMFRKDKFTIIRHYYECIDSGETFTNDQLDDINVIQATNQYRERYGIPFPEEIAQIRGQYNVSASKMSEILGLGINTYRLYESGEMPSVANGRLILSVKDPQEFIKQVEASAHLLDEKEKIKLLNRVRNILDRRHMPLFSTEPAQVALTDAAPSSLNGYRRLSIDRVAQIISFAENEVKELYRTKMNKLLFYIDFLAYKTFGCSITGLQYRAAPYGPVPAEYERLYIRLQDEDKLHIEEKIKNGQYQELYRSDITFDSTQFSQAELQILNAVTMQFKKMSTGDIVEYSHREPAWKENKDERKLINYQAYAYELRMGLQAS